jgi:hypothetical protein
MWQHTKEEEESLEQPENLNLVLPPPPIPLMRTQSFCALLHRVPSWQVPELEGVPLWHTFMDDTYVGF